MFKFSSYIGNFEPKFPAVFFCRNKGDVVCDVSPESHRSATPTVQCFAEIVLQWRNMQNFGVTMAWDVKNGVIMRVSRLCFGVVEISFGIFKKTLDISWNLWYCMC